LNSKPGLLTKPILWFLNLQVLILEWQVRLFLRWFPETLVIPPAVEDQQDRISLSYRIAVSKLIVARRRGIQ
jgi:hypothetical protein